VTIGRLIAQLGSEQPLIDLLTCYGLNIAQPALDEWRCLQLVPSSAFPQCERRRTNVFRVQKGWSFWAYSGVLWLGLWFKAGGFFWGLSVALLSGGEP